ncbi:Uma2 family endonuclease [Phormidesmis priestleyi]
MSSQLLASSVGQPIAEQRVVLEGVSWQQYEVLLATLGDDFPNLRLSYLAGTLEIMTTSPEHEELKKTIAMLIEAYFLEAGIRFHAIGSATFRKVARQRGLEPDECYCLGQKQEFPDIAIEVILTSGAIDKLEIYSGLGVREVWFWEKGQFSIYCLRSSHYEQMTHSELLPELDIALLATHVRPADQFSAVMEFRDILRQRVGSDRTSQSD